jgi:hypothetical protein
VHDGTGGDAMSELKGCREQLSALGDNDLKQFIDLNKKKLLTSITFYKVASSNLLTSIKFYKVASNILTNTQTQKRWDDEFWSLGDLVHVQYVIDHHLCFRSKFFLW